MKNILTFDIEDWYHPNLANKEALAKLPAQDRVVEPTLHILNMLEETENKATFFVVGDVARKFPELLQEMLVRGHEVASHGFEHNLVYNYTKIQFETDIAQSLEAIEKAVGTAVLGYRAPSWSLNQATPWAWEVLAAHGFRYDSSMYPFKTFLYGSNESPMFDYEIEIQNGKTVREIPPSVVEMFGKRIPFSGGFFFRVLPVWFVDRCIARINKRYGKPAVIYLHPWEIDVDQPRLDVSAKERFILYANIAKTENKLRKLLKKRSFTSMKDYYSFDRNETSALQPSTRDKLTENIK